MTETTDAILEVRNLTTQFQLRAGKLLAVNNATFRLRRGEVLGVVGESGCGKTQLAMSTMRLVPRPGVISSGEILLGGTDILQLTEDEMRSIRGNRVSMVFQEPMTALNPVFTVGQQIGESLELHTDMTHAQIREHCIELLRSVGIPDPDKRVDAYPFQLSGGLRQRVVIAIALACNPDLLIADEPTTALDVTVQAQILNLFRKIQKERNQSILFITHDLAVLSSLADRIMVMYAGEIVEIGATRDLLDNPKHPYTKGLLGSIPRTNRPAEGSRLTPIPGTVQARIEGQAVGCPFADRCPSVMDHCRTVDPPRTELEGDHAVRCHLYSDGQPRDPQGGKA